MKIKLLTLTVWTALTLMPVAIHAQYPGQIEEMTKADLIAILVSIREVAKANNEQATVNHITKMLEEIRK